MIMFMSTLRDQPCSTAAAAYQSRAWWSSFLSKRTVMWPLHVREFRAEILSQPVDDAAAPSILVLPNEYFLADGPIQADQLGIDGSQSLHLR